MGSADVVPGVSGGTVALVLGFYERLVHNIRTAAGAVGELLRGRGGEARRKLGEVEWVFIGPLLLGIGAAIVSLAALLDRLLEDEPQAVAGAFFGLVAGSIPIAWGLVRRWDRARLAMVAAAAAAAFALLGLRSGEIADPAVWMFFGAGLIAIVAMILPGISGSFILLMIGMYEAVIAAVNDRNAGELAVFAVAAIIGLAAFSTILDRMLREHHDTVMAALIGLMIGSLRVLWPWPDGTDTAVLGRPADWAIPLVAGIAGFVAVTILGVVANTGRPRT
jgi:putative membrane protein